MKNSPFRRIKGNVLFGSSFKFNTNSMKLYVSLSYETHTKVRDCGAYCIQVVLKTNNKKWTSF